MADGRGVIWNLLVRTSGRPCWTLVIVLRTEREWGFWHDGEFYRWDEYVRGKGGVADKMKACD